MKIPIIKKTWIWDWDMWLKKLWDNLTRRSEND